MAPVTATWRCLDSNNVPSAKHGFLVRELLSCDRSRVRGFTAILMRFCVVRIQARIAHNDKCTARRCVWNILNSSHVSASRQPVHQSMPLRRFWRCGPPVLCYPCIRSDLHSGTFTRCALLSIRYFAIRFFFSLKHFGHFLLRHFGHWNVSVICLTVVLKLAITVLFSWPKMTSDRNDFIFFGHIKNVSVHDRKMTEKKQPCAKQHKRLAWKFGASSHFQCFPCSQLKSKKEFEMDCRKNLSSC